ncbi:LPS assembly lipoprotein LptE [Thermodesulfobacteriota bacterium]
MADLKLIRLAFLLGMLMTISQCAYRFEGDTRLPGDINRLCITILDNRTSETGLENIFTSALIHEFSLRNSNVLTSKDEADAVLSGGIRSMRIETIARSGTQGGASIERRVTLGVLLSLTDRDGKLIWTSGELTGYEEYQVALDKIVTEQYRKDAIVHLVERLAETIYNHIAADF